MTNFKALGVGKEMDECFSEYDKSDLKKLIDSSYFESPYITNRQKEADYCMIEITDCQHENWWYSKLIGFEFFCRIVYTTSFQGHRFISRFQGVRLLKNKEIILRCFDPKDVMII